ncbi:sigma-70 family RNA polymerase sigma factor [Mangrovihabitans endophyticus]|uniref:RNA polymerase sigma factor n=1 Tax=Mangrovihabitans endophyticus TaxID=1751298 RepID=A0A8J3BUN5_9ACTN|nr:sigma-70 family RNA polymerase sigma factor [Mangrovihabitans endophyticus]GGK76259.1 DNA-directed RNA polymerase sigma-70 factor [Mangrovihabitans endophyticus]
MSTRHEPAADVTGSVCGIRQVQHGIRKTVPSGRNGSAATTGTCTRARNRASAGTPKEDSAAERNYDDLVASYGGPIRKYAARLTGNRNIADDVLQETLLRAWRHRHALVGREGSVRSWLFTVAHNVAVDLMRGRRAYPVAEETWDGLQGQVRDHADAVVASAALMPALRRLTAEHRDVLFELYYRRSTVTEAAKTIGVPPGTVKSRAHYAVRALRAELAPTVAA